MTRRLVGAAIALLACLACLRSGPTTDSRPTAAGIDHVALRASDPPQTADFYARLFGPDAKSPPRAIVANPGSVPSPHYWVKAGAGYFAISQASAENGPPAIDHTCLVFRDADADAMARLLAGLDRRFEKPSMYSIATDFWSVDPGGNLLQLDANPEGYWDRLDELGSARPATELPSTRGEAVFRTLRIARVELPATDRAASFDYYERLLGREAGSAPDAPLRVGPSQLVLVPPARGETIVVAVAEASPEAILARLRENGFEGARSAADPSAIELRDPDGTRLRIVSTSAARPLP
ncbi:MAG: VOC family protein [Myxococcota bacterium]